MDEREHTHCSVREAGPEGRIALVCPGSHSKTEGWGLQQQERISYSSGAQTSEIRASGWSGSGEALFLVGPGSSLRPHMEEGLRRPLGGLFHKSTNPIHGVSTLTTSSPPQGPPTHTITLGVRFQHVHFEGDTNIQPRIITKYMTAFIINIQNRQIQRQGVGEWGQALGERKGNGRT